MITLVFTSTHKLGFEFDFLNCRKVYSKRKFKNYLCFCESVLIGIFFTQVFTQSGNNYSKMLERLLRKTTLSTNCEGKYYFIYTYVYLLVALKLFGKYLHKNKTGFNFQYETSSEKTFLIFHGQLVTHFFTPKLHQMFYFCYSTLLQCMHAYVLICEWFFSTF